MTSPYLERPVRSLSEAQWQRDKALAERRMRHLAPFGVTVAPPLALVKERDARERGIPLPKKE